MRCNVAALAAAVMLVLSSCTSTAEPESEQPEIAEDLADIIATATVPPLPTPTPAIPDAGTGPVLVGSVMAQSGVMERVDLPALEGVRLQVERLNAAGGVLGRPVELVEIDSESRIGITWNATKDLVSAGVDLLLVSCDPVRAAPAVEVAEEHGVLVMSPCGADEDWLDAGPLVFSLGVSAAQEARVMAEWAFENGIESVVTLLDDTNPDVEQFCRSFAVHYRAIGGTVVWGDRFTFDSLDPFEDRLAQRPIGTQGVVVCSHLPGGLNGAPNIIELVRDRGITAPIIAGSSLDGGPSWFNIVNELGQLTYTTPTSVYGDDPVAAVRELVEEINGDQPVPPARGWSILGAEAVLAWATAVDDADSVDGADVAEALERFRNEPLIVSTITFGPGVHMDTNRELRVIQIEDGEIGLAEIRSTPDG